MITIKRILCPTDLSINSDQAVLYSLALARAYEAKLIICYNAAGAEPVNVGIQRSELDYALSRGKVRDLFEGVLLNFLAPISFANLDWEGVVTEGTDVGEQIIQTATERDVDLIVMRSRRRPHRAAILGSTAESVCRTAPCPVFVTHSSEREWVKPATQEIGLTRVLVPYDFSDYAELALKYGLSLAQEYQAEIHLLHVLPSNSFREPELRWYPNGGEASYHKATKRLQNVIPPEAHLWCAVKTAIAEGQPYREVLNYAERHDIDLISIGAHGAGFGMRALFGSNVDRVLRQAPCPVLVARPLKPGNVQTFGPQ